MKQEEHTPDLESRFLQPASWQWGEFERVQGRRIRFGHVTPEDREPIATIICLAGLSEFCEKYYETAHDLLKLGYAFWIMDWMGQGGSGRYLEGNPLKRHSTDFNEDVADLHHFIERSVKPNTTAPLAMLAHSMGGNIGLRYMAEHQSTFITAIFSAPMIGIEALKFMPMKAALALAASLNLTIGKIFTSYHGQAGQRQRSIFKNNPLSSDPQRFSLDRTWAKHKRELDIGDVTYGWVYEALKSCAAVQKSGSKIKCPCLFALSEKEEIVDNSATRKLVTTVAEAEILELPNAHHEILMECDEIRSLFIGNIDRMIKKRIAQEEGLNQTSEKGNL